MAHQTCKLPKKEEIQQQLTTIAIQHYRLLQQQRRATTTTTTTPITHLQKTDMITTMSRGIQEDRVGSVEGIQVDHEEEEVEEVAEVEEEEEEEEEEEMEKVEGSEIFGNESTENVSSGDGDFCEVSSTQKRTSTGLNIAQDSAPTIAHAVSKGVENDPKQAQTKKLTARGLFKNVSTRANTIYSIYKAKWIPNTDTNASTNANAKLNIINNNINGVNNVTEKEENSIIYDGIDITTQEKKNSISGTINIYDTSGQIGENDNKLVNNNGCNNINDNHNNNTSELNEENTPGEVKCENNTKLFESVDSYPMNLQMEIPILRLRGGVGEEENGEMVEETVGERFILTTLDEE
jgi:hypothetical protein